FVYNVFNTAKITSAIGNNGMKQMFRGPASLVCTTGASVIANFGFLNLPTGDENTVGQCGSIATKGSLISGSL
ncbi:MAG: hypothetical protein H0U92_14560, partial [Actinobacteria bacterium]|nr:hypothetical protein [Actinomycetota bacterium]